MATSFFFGGTELESTTIPDGTYLNTTPVLLSPAPIVGTLSGHNVYRKTLLTTAINDNKNISLTGSIASFNGMFFGRYQSAPLAAQTIPTQTWTMVPNQGEGSTGANTFHWPYLVIYRPSTQQVVHTFLDGSGTFGGTEWSGGQTTGNPQTYANLPGFTTQDGDVLIYEAWAALETAGSAVPTMTGTHVWGLDHTSARWNSAYTFTFYTPPAGPVGSVSVTEDADTVAADATLGALPLVATAVMTEAGDIAASTATVVWPPRTANLSVTEAADTVAATSVNPRVGTSTLTEADDTVASTATVAFPPALAAAVLTEAADTVASTATVVTVVRTANLAVTEAADTISATSVNPRVGTSALTEAADTVASTAVVVAIAPANADLAVTEAADTVASTAVVINPALADLSVTEAADAVVSTAVVVPFPVIVANLSVTEASDAVASTASAAFPLIETFQENFEGDTSKWNVFATGGTVTFEDGTSVQAITSAVDGNQATIISKDHYNFIGSSLFWKFVQPIRVPGDVSGIQNGMGVRTPTGGRTIQWFLDTTGALQAVKQDNFAITVIATVEPAYYANPLPFTWLRVHELAGTVYWDSAPDTASNPPIESDWVNRATAPTSTIVGPWTDSLVNLYAYMGTALAGVPTQPLRIDGVNTAANAPPGVSQGVLAVTEAADTVTSSVSVLARANVVLTEAKDTLAATSVNPRVGNATLVETSDTVSATSVNPRVGNSALTEAKDTVASTTRSIAGASAVLTEANDAVSSTANVGFPQINIDSALTEASDTVAATSVNPRIANASITEAGDSIASTARVGVTATAALTEAADALSSTATVFSGVRSDAAITEANDTLSSTARSIAGATAALVEAPDTASATAVVTIAPRVANAAMTEAPDTVLGYTVKPRKRAILIT